MPECHLCSTSCLPRYSYFTHNQSEKEEFSSQDDSSDVFYVFVGPADAQRLDERLDPRGCIVWVSVALHSNFLEERTALHQQCHKLQEAIQYFVYNLQKMC